MTDIVKRLRDPKAGYCYRCCEAAEEIERLHARYDENEIMWQNIASGHLKQIKNLRAALERLDSLAQDPQNVRRMRQIVRNIAREALNND